MRVALVASPETDSRLLVQAARLLQAKQHTVCVVEAQLDERAAVPAAASTWGAAGLEYTVVSAGHWPPETRHFPRDAAWRTAQALAPVVAGFDLVWFDEPWWATPLLRARRFDATMRGCVVVGRERDAESLPAGLNAINHRFAAQYAERWADGVVEWREAAVRLEAVEELCARVRAQPLREPRQAATEPAVTVCVPYYEEPQFLEQTLLSLEAQKCENFTVVVVDDGSESAAGREAFADCERRFARHGWTFVRQPNAGAGAARNFAASQTTTEFLIFLDADDIAMPTMVESFLRAALLSGDDCLVARNYGFAEDPEGPCELLYDPPGNSLVSSMGDDMHGGSCLLIRREAFACLGGFTEVRGVGYEDYELHVRANLAGMRWDVLPELIYRYRQPREGGVSRSTSNFRNLQRVLRNYRETLQPTGLAALPEAFAAAYWSLEKQNDQADHWRRMLAPRKARQGVRGKELKLLLLTCHFPFELSSGWHNRVQQMIRFLGARHELTLMNAMRRELLHAHRDETFAQVHSMLGVEHSAELAPTAPGTPFRVREQYTEVFRRAVRSLPTEQYHAVLLDQIFLGEFRRDVDAPVVLSEHNIESRLLRQAAERTWGHDLPLHYQNAQHEADRLEAYETKAWQEFPVRAVVSEVDREEMDRRCGVGRTVVAANGADPSTYVNELRFEAKTVLFSGHLAYLPNVDAVSWLLSEVWPRVRAAIPDAKLVLAGRSPSPVVEQAVASSIGNVRLLASPEDMRAVAATASVSIAPLRLGSGTRLKILEALAWGLPVVSTRLGAEGIDVMDGEHALLREDAAAFADAVVQLLRDRALWMKLRKNGAELVRARYAWERVFEPFHAALLELIG